MHDSRGASGPPVSSRQQLYPQAGLRQERHVVTGQRARSMPLDVATRSQCSGRTRGGPRGESLGMANSGVAGPPWTRGRFTRHDALQGPPCLRWPAQVHCRWDRCSVCGTTRPTAAAKALKTKRCVAPSGAWGGATATAFAQAAKVRVPCSTHARGRQAGLGGVWRSS